jgi:hypothetical protein
MPRLAPPVAELPTSRAPLSLFADDGLHRLLVRLRVEGREAPDLLRRAVWGVLLAWCPLVLLAALSGNLLVAVPDETAGIATTLPGWLGLYVPRESLALDLAAYAQFLGFIPLAFFAEGFIGRKIENALERLRPIVDDNALVGLARRANRLSRSVAADLGIVVLAYAAMWSWGYAELHNGLPSWHTAVVHGGADGYFTALVSEEPVVLEHFTPAGYWAALFALPLFTYLWMRWVWKVAAWTYFLVRVSRLRLMLRAAHPDRTGGLGCLSDVQTSFATILFGTGLLFAAWAVHKFVFERTPIGSMDVWGPILFYVFLAPGTFIAPLFLFTGTLARVKREGMVRYGEMAAALASRFERRWMRGDRRQADDLLDSPHASSLSDFTLSYQTVEGMRVVPFDRRSFIELFSASATPFAPLAFLLELPEKFRSLMSLLGG